MVLKKTIIKNGDVINIYKKTTLSGKPFYELFLNGKLMDADDKYKKLLMNSEVIFRLYGKEN